MNEKDEGVPLWIEGNTPDTAAFHLLQRLYPALETRSELSGPALNRSSSEWVIGASGELLRAGLVDALEDAMRMYAEEDVLGLLNFWREGICPELPHLFLTAIRSPFGYEISSRLAGPERLRGDHQHYFARNSDGPSTVPHLFLSVMENGQPIESTNVPLPFLVTTAPNAVGRHLVYRHDFNDVKIPGTEEASYIGITKQSARARWLQHVACARSGSDYRFHRALSTLLPSADIAHTIIGCATSQEVALKAEEILVAAASLHPKGLNAIPGGRAGWEFLARYGVRPKRENMASGWERRHVLLEHLAERCQRQGKPNPLLATRWLDDAYAASIICGNPRNFSLEQVREVRYLESLGHGVDAIAAMLGCPARRVLALVSGRTYTRVR